MNKFVQLCGAIVLSVGWLLAHAQQNLLSNGDFSNTNQVSGWTPSSGALRWSSDDADGLGSSGSMEFDLPSTGGAVSGCFAVVPNATVNMTGKNRVLAGTDLFELIRFRCSIYSDTVCQSSVLEVLDLRGQGTSSTWVDMAASPPAPPDNSSTLPPTARSAHCEIQLAVLPGNTASMLFDDLSFSSQAATPVTLQSFDVK